MNQKDIKLLWGRSGNKCAICRTELTQDKEAVRAAYVLGVHAHIVGEKEDAARGKSQLTDTERDSYHNMILLCPTCHTTIDQNEEDWPIERLHITKSKHELWANERLSETTDPKAEVGKIVCANIIDTVVQCCNLEQWRIWTGWALGPDPRWPKSLPRALSDCRDKVVFAVWPDGSDSLRRAASTLTILLDRAGQKFLEHSEERGEFLLPIKFYKLLDFNPNYDRDVEAYDTWLEEGYELIREATKAANWFADVVRQEINPMFFALDGRFLVEEGPFEDFSFRVRLLEYTRDEKEKLPDSLFQPTSGAAL